jgi:YesN/AraC family two-component response regulator
VANPVCLELEHDIAVIGEAEEGETGVALVLREQPDIVVMDMRMPRIDGFEATKRI